MGRIYWVSEEMCLHRRWLRIGSQLCKVYQVSVLDNRMFLCIHGFERGVAFLSYPRLQGGKAFARERFGSCQVSGFLGRVWGLGFGVQGLELRFEALHERIPASATRQ